METRKTLEQVLLENFDFDGLTDEQSKELKNNIAEILLENTFIRILEDIEEDKASSLEVFLEKEPTRNEFIDYLNKNIPNFYTILFEEVEILKEEV
jgi:ribosomal protein S8